MRTRSSIGLAILTATTVTLGGLALATVPAAAATLTVCADGCDHTSVAAAVAAASDGDTIEVGPGTYSEPAIVVDKALDIVGAGSGSTIIDGGAANLGVTGQLQLRTQVGEDVTVTGLTIRNPVRGGTTVSVLAKSLANPGPDYVLDDVVIEGNGTGNEYGLWTENSTASLTFRNGSISGQNFNPVLIEEPRAATSILDSTIAAGVGGGGYFSMKPNPNGTGLDSTGTQLVRGNTFTGGANVTFFADFLQNGAGGYDHVVVEGNTFEGITAAGIRVHNNAPNGAGGQNDAAVIADNVLVGAGGTSRGIEVSGGLGSAVVTGNDVSGFGVGVRFLANPSGSVGSATVTANRIVGNGVGLDNGTGTAVDAEGNWWGCNAGPGADGCDTTTGSVDADPRVVLDLTGPASVSWPGGATFTASLDQLSDGSPASPDLPGGDVAFAASAGTIDASAPLSGGTADASYVPPAVNDPVTISATFDEQTVSVDATVVDAPLVPTTLTAQGMVVDSSPFLRIRVGGVGARLTETATGTPIPGRTITFAAGSGFLCQAVTDANGVAECGFSLTGVLAGVLNLGYVATFPGDAKFAPAGGGGDSRGPLIKLGGLRLL